MLMRVAEQEKVSLTIMGTHQKTSIDSLLHGSVSYDLLHHMNTHVLILRQNDSECPSGNTPEENYPHVFSKVLVPVDFTENSRKMHAFVRGMIGIGELVLQHVVTKGDTEQEIEQNIALTGEELATVQKDLEHAGFRVMVHVHVGNAGEKIVALAEEGAGLRNSFRTVRHSLSCGMQRDRCWSCGWGSAK
jgi:nucleotide-binding universal stress UspA family protein